MTDHPVTVQVLPATEGRNRLTTAFRFFLAIPHLLLVGGPTAVGVGVGVSLQEGVGWSSSGGVLGYFVCLTTVALWFVIVITASHVAALWRFGAFYLRWRVRSMAYVMLLRDEYPPFGDGDADYPAELRLDAPGDRNRMTVFFRLLLALPHLFVLMLLGAVWAFTTAVAWIFILFTGRYPETPYGFALGVLAWTVRVEAYLLLLRDEYPPFTLRT
jgi:hypothetical protein